MTLAPLATVMPHTPHWLRPTRADGIELIAEQKIQLLQEEPNLNMGHLRRLCKTTICRLGALVPSGCDTSHNQPCGAAAALPAALLLFGCRP